MIIKEFVGKYRDDMIFMVLQAKNALGRVPHLNEDLLDIEKNYLDKGDSFYIALDENDRVIGCGGYTSHGDGTATLHRLFVKSERKRQGIGSALLEKLENDMRSHGIKTSLVHLGGEEYFESRSFYPKHGYAEYEERMMKKDLL